jgi:hypothetical protein
MITEKPYNLKIATLKENMNIRLLLENVAWEVDYDTDRKTREVKLILDGYNIPTEIKTITINNKQHKFIETQHQIIDTNIRFIVDDVKFKDDYMFDKEQYYKDVKKWE